MNKLEKYPLDYHLGQVGNVEIPQNAFLAANRAREQFPSMEEIFNENLEVGESMNTW